MRLLWMILCALPVLGQVRATIEVYRPSTFEPLAGVKLEVLAADGAYRIAGSGVTDDDGRAEFTLPAGKYMVSGSRADFGSTYWGQVVENWVGVVVLKDDAPRPTITFPIEPPVLVSGVVRGESGEGLEGARVLLTQPLWENGVRRHVEKARAVAGERGEFAIAQVASGDYELCVDAVGASEAVARAIVRAARSERHLARSCVEVTADGSFTPQGLVLRSQQGLTSAADLAGPAVIPVNLLELAVEEGAPGVSGSLEQAGLADAAGKPLELIEGQPVRVESGLFWLTYRAGRGSCVTGAELDGTEILGRSFELSGGSGRITVRVSRACPAPQEVRAMTRGQAVEHARVAVLVSGTAERPGFAYTGIADSEGRYEIEGLAPGTYRVWAWPHDYAGPEHLREVAELGTDVTITMQGGETVIVEALPAPSKH